MAVVPTSFNQVTASELSDRGVNVVIYANQLLRAAYPAMVNAAQEILRHGRSYESDQSGLSIQELLSIIPGNGV